jgi:hypothetical protein
MPFFPMARSRDLSCQRLKEYSFAMMMGRMSLKNQNSGGLHLDRRFQLQLMAA